MPRVGIEPTISAGERPKTYALHRAATGTGKFYLNNIFYIQGIPLATELVACHICGAQNFEVPPRFLGEICTPRL